MVNISIDIDGVLDYPDNVQMVNRLYAVRENFIMLNTARGESFREKTKTQLREWGVDYHLLLMGKLKADYYIDDKNIELRDLYDKQFGDEPKGPPEQEGKIRIKKKDEKNWVDIDIRDKSHVGSSCPDPRHTV